MPDHPISNSVEKFLAGHQVDSSSVRHRIGKSRGRHVSRQPAVRAQAVRHTCPVLEKGFAMADNAREGGGTERKGKWEGGEGGGGRGGEGRGRDKGEVLGSFAYYVSSGYWSHVLAPGRYEYGGGMGRHGILPTGRPNWTRKYGLAVAAKALVDT